MIRRVIAGGRLPFAVLVLVCAALLLVPGSQHSSSFQAAGPATIISVSPGLTYTDSGQLLLDVRGTNFVSSSAIRVNGTVRSTVFVSSSQLTSTLADTDTAKVGSLSITVRTESAAGATISNALSVNVVSRTAASSQFPLNLRTMGGTVLQTQGASASASVGYARIQPDNGQNAPAGFVIFGYRSNGVLVSETSVPASTPVTSARIYVENADRLKTGIAIANPGTRAATITYTFTDVSGVDRGKGTLTLAAGNQIAKFLDEAPFGAPAVFQGTVTLTSSVPVGAVALRGLLNDRNDFLMSTLPVTDLSLVPGSDPVIVPHFADGGGWKTHVLLVNPTDAALAGTVQFMPQTPGGVATPPLRITIAGQAGSIFPFTIAPRSSVRLSTESTGATANVGWIRVAPSGTQKTPAVLSVFSYRNGSITTTEAGVAGVRTGTSFRIYAESSEDTGGDREIETGLAIANSGSQQAVLSLDLLTMDGSPSGLRGTATVPA